MGVSEGVSLATDISEVSNDQLLPQVSAPLSSSSQTLRSFEHQTESALQITELDSKSVDNPQDWFQGFSAPPEAQLNADSRPPSDEASAKITWTSARPDGHAPIGVMGEHTHSAGEVMFSYRYTRMEMTGNLDGTNNLTNAEVLQQFPVTPTQMTGEMHMFGVMYAPTDELTLMAMVPYVFKSMNHLTRRGVRFRTRSDGVGDVQFTGLYKILDHNRQRLHFNAGVSFPTGSTNERDDTPAGPKQVLPYPMQTGSGTFDLHPGLTYLGQTDQWSWGAQGTGTIRLGKNENSYRLGNQVNLTGWGARRWTNWLSTSVRLNGRIWSDIAGADPRLNPMMVPTADPNLRGGTRLDLLFGINFSASRGLLKGNRLALEAGIPLYQSLDGPQLETDWLLTLGWQGSF